jgi:hypothetical protein
MNAGIIACICRSSQQPINNANPRRTFSGQMSVNTRLVQRNKQQVTIMLLIVSFSWFVLTMPYAVLSLINFNIPNNHTRAVIFLAKTISFLLMYLNHSCNFFLYCIAGKKIRAELICMFKDWGQTCQRRRLNTYSMNELVYRTSRQRTRATPITPACEPILSRSRLPEANHSLLDKRADCHVVKANHIAPSIKDAKSF